MLSLSSFLKASFLLFSIIINNYYIIIFCRQSITTYIKYFYYSYLWVRFVKPTRATRKPQKIIQNSVERTFSSDI